MPQNIQIYKNLPTPASALFPFKNPKSTWRCADVDRPHMLQHAHIQPLMVNVNHLMNVHAYK